MWDHLVFEHFHSNFFSVIFHLGIVSKHFWPLLCFISHARIKLWEFDILSDHYIPDCYDPWSLCCVDHHISLFVTAETDIWQLKLVYQVSWKQHQCISEVECFVSWVKKVNLCHILGFTIYNVFVPFKVPPNNCIPFWMLAKTSFPWNPKSFSATMDSQ